MRRRKPLGSKIGTQISFNFNTIWAEEEEGATEWEKEQEMWREREEERIDKFVWEERNHQFHFVGHAKSL